MRDEPDRAVITLTQRVASSLFGAGRVPDCTAQACLTLLANRPALCDAAEHRVALLSGLLAELDVTALQADKRSLHYLLHGSVKHFESSGPLLFEPEAWESPV